MSTTVTNVRLQREFRDDPLMALITYTCGHTIATRYRVSGRRKFTTCPRCAANAQARRTKEQS